AEALGMTNLNGGTLCNAEFGIRHRAAPYRKGQVLHSVFAAALYNVVVTRYCFCGACFNIFCLNALMSCENKNFRAAKSLVVLHFFYQGAHR
ncbi:hypothetical protein, partial [Pseudomonas sp. 5Ae-yellow]|uniref:hypothetical protein n=1 Tax=Pseudomonas sp. 5Ae-yellow TaxID=2759848 RepID=UPI001C71471A